MSSHRGCETFLSLGQNTGVSRSLHLWLRCRQMVGIITWSLRNIDTQTSTWRDIMMELKWPGAGHGGGPRGLDGMHRSLRLSSQDKVSLTLDYTEAKFLILVSYVALIFSDIHLSIKLKMSSIFVKGSSANLSGRPTVMPELRALKRKVVGHKRMRFNASKPWCVLLGTFCDQALSLSSFTASLIATYRQFHFLTEKKAPVKGAGSVTYAWLPRTVITTCLAVLGKQH